MTSRSICTAGISGAILAATAEGSMVQRLIAKGWGSLGTELAEFRLGLAGTHSLAVLGALACVVLALRVPRRD
jgi:hypothetical protein